MHEALGFIPSTSEREREGGRKEGRKVILDRFLLFYLRCQDSR
jgi:hypothetical protein